MFTTQHKVFTPGALDAFVNEVAKSKSGLPSESLMKAVINRFHAGDWGETPEEDKELNNQSVRDGSRVMASYVLPLTGVKVWAIAEAKDDNGIRLATTLLLPNEY